jgi:hypothetical protein
VWRLIFGLAGLDLRPLSLFFTLAGSG